MTADQRAAADPLTADLHELLHGLGARMKAHLERCAGALGLTVPQAAALRHLQSPVPMRDLAEHLYCDASNVTGIVDRLEEAGLAERRPDPDDRRVKTVVLTGEGRRRLDELHRVFVERHPVLHGLDDEDRRILRDLLAKVLAAG